MKLYSAISLLVGGLGTVALAETAPRALVDGDFLNVGENHALQAELGRLLFFDPILSGNRNISCGTCHDPTRGSGDGLSLGVGEGGLGMGADRRTRDGVTERVPRNAQPLYNVGALEYTSMFHDGRVEWDADKVFDSGFWTPAREDLPTGLNSLLAAQAMFPVLSSVEMAGQKGENPVATAAADDQLAGPGGAWDLLAERLRTTPAYAYMFEKAFEDVEAAEDITFVHAANAIAAFETDAFRSHGSPFDLFLESGTPLLPAAERGRMLFYGDAECSACHSGPLLTDHKFHAIAVPQIGPGKGHGSDTTYWRSSGFPDRLEDEGRFRVSFAPEDLFAFRTPSLRNVAVTGPWGHNGAFDDLEDIVRHHLDPVASLSSFPVSSAAVRLPQLDKVVERRAVSSSLSFEPLNPARRAAFDGRDTWVMRSDVLRGRIAAANDLHLRTLDDTQIADLIAFLEALTSPEVHEARHLIPDRVPSGLPPQPVRPAH